MYRIEHTAYLWLLLLIPLIFIIFYINKRWQQKQWHKLGTSAVAQSQQVGHIKGRSILKTIVLAGSVTFGILALANFQQKDGTQTVDKKGIDLVFALDVSKSMLANDIQPDRLSKAKLFINTLLGKMTNNRTGLVVFAGSAYQQIPITTDQGAVKMILETVNTNIIPNQGTVISDALSAANQMFEGDWKKYKAIVLITDGEDHDENATALAQEVSETGTVIFTVGIGSPEGTTITDPATNQPKKDPNGEIVISKLNEAILKEIANIGKGGYIQLKNVNSAAQHIYDAVDRMEKNKLGSSDLQQYKSYYQYFLQISLLLLVAYLIIPNAQKIK